MVELNRGINEGFGIVGGMTRDGSNTTPTTIEQFAQIFAAVYGA